MKLYELPLGAKIYSQDGDIMATTIKEARSTCGFFILADTKIGKVYFQSSIPITKYKDGYRIINELEQ